ncbi:hypothetical protein Tco_0931756 [Tanacetum coccineum]
MVLAYKSGLELVEEKLEVYKANESIYSQDIKVLKIEIEYKDIAIRELRKKLEIAQKEKDGIQFNVDKFENASKSLNKLIESQIVDNCKKGLGYNVVLPPYIGNFIPPTPDLSFTGLDCNISQFQRTTYSAVMSSASSAVTYTSVYTDSEPERIFWGANLTVYIPLEDEHEFLVKEQPLPPVDSPTSESPGYVVESDLEEDPEEYEDDETEDGPVDYPMDGGKDGDDDDGDSSGDDADDEDEDEEDEDKGDEEEEEHLALADSAVVASISLPPKAEVKRLLAMPTPPPSPPILLSPPSTGERLARCMAPSAHSSSPHVPSPLLPSSGRPTQIQTLRIASTQALVDAVTVALPSPPLPPLPPSLYIPPLVDCRDDIPESERPPRKRLCLSNLGSSTLDAKERRRWIREVGYGIRDTWVDSAEAVPEIAPMTVGEVNTRVTELAEIREHDTQYLYALLEDA